MEFRNIVDQLHDYDGLSHPGAAKSTHLATLQKRADQINHFNAGRKHLRRSRLVHERWRSAVDWIVLLRLDRAAFIHGVSGNVEYPPHNALTDRHGYRAAAVGDLEAPLESLRGGHGDCSNQFVPEVLLHFERHLGGPVLHFVLNRQRVIDSRQRFRELDVHYRTDNFCDPAFVHIHTHLHRSMTFLYSDWPPAISSSSLVIFPCRCLLYSSDRSLIRRSALSVAFFIDTMRALCSLALALSKTW